MVPSFSVVANAAEAEENLVDSDLSTWLNASSIDSNCSSDFFARYYNGSYIFQHSSYPSAGSYGVIYSLPNLTVGENYLLSFDFGINEASLKYLTYMIGFGYCFNNQIEFYSDDSYIVVSYDNYTDYGYIVGQASSTLNSIKIPFTYNATLGEPCIIISAICHTKSSTNGPTIYFKNFSLTRQSSEAEKKLDGILGWLQDIKNTLTGLPELIKTSLSSFFTDLSNKLTELKNNIKTNLETLGSNINGKLGDVSTDFSSYVTGLGDRVSSFFTDLKNKLTSEFTDFKNKVNTEFTNLKSNLTTNFDNLKSSLSARFDRVDTFLTEIRDFFHNLYWDLVGGTCGKGDVHSSLFERLGDRIRGFFEDLKVKIDIKVEEIKTAIHDFFVPPEGFFEEWKGNFDLMLETNLGFIYESFDVVESTFHILKYFFVDVPEPMITFPAIEFELAGKQIQLTDSIDVDLTDFTKSDLLSDIYSMYKVLLHIIFISGLIFYAKKIWERTMSN